MKVINQSHAILSITHDLLTLIEECGRTCYKSENKITPTSAGKFVRMLRDHKHHAMIEFGDITVKFVTNRGVTHELVRHRLCSFAQESTRYVNYGSDDISFIKPSWWNDNPADYKTIRVQKAWCDAMKKAENAYNELLYYGWKPQQAREALPNSLKTEIVVKANIREWRHIFQLRCSKAAHPQIRSLMLPLLAELKAKIPVLFDDIEVLA